jgi:hypothetical protein
MQGYSLYKLAIRTFISLPKEKPSGEGRKTFSDS